MQFLGGAPGEEKPMLLLLGKGFFMGILLATYQIGAETLFLDVLGDEWLDNAFFAAGFAGIISTSIFVYLQRKINYSSLILSTTFLIFIFIGGIRIAFEFIGYDDSIKGAFQILPFVLFVMIGPVTTITLLGFWGIFGRIFDLRASKRIIGGIDTGQLIATMIAFFSIPLLTSTIIGPTYDLLLVSVIAAVGVFVFTLFLTLNFNLNKATHVLKGEAVKKVSFTSLLKDKYLRLLCIFLIFSKAVGIFTEYTFLSATETMYTDEEELAYFLSFFSGTVILFSFVIQSFVNDYIIGKFGLKVALMTMPFILSLFTVGAITVGHIFGYEIKTENFIFFFVLTGTARLFTAALRDALESPAFKLFFLPLDIKIRFDIQTRIEGVVSEIGAFAAGAIQMAFGLLAFFKLIHYTYFILFLTAWVIYLSAKLFEAYKNTLKKTLETQKEGLMDQGKRNNQNTRDVLENEWMQNEPKPVFNALSILENIDPIQFEKSLLVLTDHRHPEIRIHAYNMLGERGCLEAYKSLEKGIQSENNEEVRLAAEACITKLAELKAVKLTEASIRGLVRSVEPADRVLGAQLLAQITEERHVSYLMELLRDINTEVRTAAILTAGKLRRPELWVVLIENLHLPTYGNVAMSALSIAGKNGLHILDTAFYKTGQHHLTMMRIVQIIGQIGGKQGEKLLWKKIDFPDKKIISQLLLSLSYLGFMSEDFQSVRIKLSLETEIGDIAWNIKAGLEIPSESEIDLLLKEAMREEDVKNYDNIFMLLSMLYDPQSVLLARENIVNGTTDSITFAVEMLDIFIDEELKPKLIPVVDDLKIPERLAKLHDHYPPEYFDSYEDLLLQIINRDFNRINRYTKAIAMYRFSELSTHVTADLIANLFNPDPLLLQTAAFAIYKIDKEAYYKHTKRLRPVVKKGLDKDILPPIYKEEGEAFHQKLLLIERVLLLKNIDILQSIPGELITLMAELMEEWKIKMGETLVREGDKGSVPLFVVVDGSMDIYEGDLLVEEKKQGEVFGEKMMLAAQEAPFTALARGECTLLVLKKADLFNLMTQHIEIMQCWKEILNEEMDVGEKIVDVLFSET